MAISPAERFGRLEVRMDGVEAAVLNFRNLDKNINEFMTEFRTLKKADDEFHNKRDEEIKNAAQAAAAHLESRHEARDEADRRFKRWVSVVGVVISFLLLVIAYREFSRKIVAVNKSEPTVQPLNAPQASEGSRPSW